MHNRGLVLCVLLLLASAGAQQGCSAGRGNSARLATGQESSAIESRLELERLAAAQARRRLPPRPIPAELDLPVLTPVAAEDALARVPLAEAISQAAALALPEPAAAAPPPPSRTPDVLALDAAMRLYISARLDLAERRPGPALSQLQSATRLDPESPALWSALGEAQQMAGMTRPAVESYARAVQLGARDALTLLSLGRLLAADGDQAAAAACLARMSGDAALRGDPALGAIYWTSLGQALIELGYLAAGAEALRDGVQLPGHFGQPTPYYEELAEISRRRSELWRTIGDALCRLERYEEALSAYSAAGQFPSLDPGLLHGRRMYVALRLGQPAAAALDLLSALLPAEGLPRVEERQIALIRALAEHNPEVGPPLARSFLAALHQPAGPLPTSIAGRLVRAAAAALPDRAAVGLLQERLAAHPEDAECLTALLARSGDAGSAAGVLVRLADASPLHAEAMASALRSPRAAAAGAPDHVRGGAILPELEARRGGTGSRLLAAALSVEIGEPGRAEAVLLELRGRAPADVMIAAVTVSLAARTGAWELALPALGVLEQGDVAPMVKARALAAVQRFGPALAVLEAAALESLTPADLRVAAEIAAALGEAQLQERFLRRAVQVDPLDDRAALPLLRLYTAPGPRQDRRKAMELLRTLREFAPSSRILRLLRAEELLGSGRLALAQAELLSLAEEDPGDAVPLQLLAEAWRGGAGAGQAAALDQARARLEPLVEEHGNESPWLIVAASVLAAAGDEPEWAETLLEARAGGPAGANGAILGPALEQLLRRTGRGAEADARAAARLASARPTIDATVELAAWLAQSRRTGEAAEALRTRLPAGVHLTPAQSATLFTAVEQACQAVSAAPSPARMQGALALLESALPLVRSAPLSLHSARLSLLVEAHEPDLDGLLEAVALAGEQHPGEAERLHISVASRLAELRLPAAALAYVARASQASDPPPMPLVRQWLLLGATIGEPAEAVAPVRFILERGLAGALAGGSTDLSDGELAYQAGVIATTHGREQTAVALYELALVLEPAHAWAANNLGYTLLERDGPTDRAAGLIESAHAALPDSASVMDSLGWLRYKQGVLEDRLDPQTGVNHPGAVSLLRRAIELSEPASPVMWDHLGDALWVAGRRDEATSAWRAAERLATELLRVAPARGGRGSRGGAASSAELPEALFRKYTDLLQSVRGKHVAAVRGRAPAIAPIPVQRPAEQPERAATGEHGS